MEGNHSLGLLMMIFCLRHQGRTYMSNREWAIAGSPQVWYNSSSAPINHTDVARMAQLFGRAAPLPAPNRTRDVFEFSCNVGLHDRLAGRSSSFKLKLIYDVGIMCSTTSRTGARKLLKNPLLEHQSSKNMYTEFPTPTPVTVLLAGFIYRLWKLLNFVPIKVDGWAPAAEAVLLTC